MISIINEFGAADVVQVIQDGANKATWPIIEHEFSWIVCSWCVAHVIDLWFEDIGKMAFFKDIGLLTDTSTRRSETRWILQPLKSLSTFTRTAKLWQ